MSQRPILIVGGSGKTGGRVNTLLLAHGIATRPVSRSTAIPFDWTAPETWPAALEGVSRAYVTYQPDLAVEGAAEAIAKLGLAEAVVVALTDERHANKLYEVTGPRALTFAEAVDEIAAAIGRPIRYTQISLEEFAARMRQARVPEDVIVLLNELFSVVLDGRNSQVMHGVEEALGRPARDFSDYARDTAATGVWKA